MRVSELQKSPGRKFPQTPLAVHTLVHTESDHNKTTVEKGAILSENVPKNDLAL